MTDELKPLLQQLSEPEPPASISATVMARIAREVERRAEAEAAPALRPRERPTWLFAVAAIAIVFLVVANGWLSSGLIPSLTSPRIGVDRPPLMPLLDVRLTALMALAFLIYLAGLFAPLRSGSRR